MSTKKKRPGKRERMHSKQAKLVRVETIKRNNAEVFIDPDIRKTNMRTNSTQLARVHEMHRPILTCTGKRFNAGFNGYDRGPDLVTKDKHGVVTKESRTRRLPSLKELPEHVLTHKRFSQK